LVKAAPVIRRTASKVLAIPFEDYNMHRFLVLSALVLSTAVIGPVIARADDANHQERRYYDRGGKDYHTWNDNEDRAYRSYLQEQHRDYRDFNKVKRPQQQQYFTWRHQHPDNTLFKIEIR
jgi:type III secretory pathway component EscR